MKRRLFIFGIALALYAAFLAVTWKIGTDSARKKTEWQLEFAMVDLHDTVGGAIDTMLDHVARSVVRFVRAPERLAMDRVAEIARQLDVDEVNIVTRAGEIVATNDRLCLGVIMAGDPVMDEFMKLTNGTTSTVSQPFRPHARNPKFRAKYVAAAFPGGNGFVQVGLDERRLARMLPDILGNIFDEWLLGRTGFFLCAEEKTGCLVSNPSRHRDEARTLEEAGYDVESSRRYEVVCEANATSETFVQRLFGEKCYCRAMTWGGHRFVAALPEREFYDTRTVFVTVFAVLFFMVLGAFAFFLDRIFRDSDRLKAFYAGEAAHRAKEMEIAKAIQVSALPGAPPDSPYYRIDAAMQAARDVGGDFYDYFHVDATHVAFLVADVSGKGITAAFYMMTAKTLIKDTLLAVRDPAVALTKANAELCATNHANMFLTAWVGVLDLETGTVVFANAGHNPPVKIEPSDGASDPPASRLTALVEKSGPVLAFMDGIVYKPLTVQLSPGDALFLYTDGVTEALDKKDALFGESKLMDVLKVAPVDPHSICMVVRAAVAAFAEGAPQADDITVLAVRYVAAPCVPPRSFPPTQDGIASASKWLDETLAACADSAAGEALASPLHVILDEICSNIVRHSGASGFEVGLVLGKGKVTLTFSDDGVPYNPLAHADPDTTAPAEARPIGGLGIMIVKKLASSVSYRRVRDRNVLVVERAC